MSQSLLRFSRVLHLYFGVFITPAILFFALTGALQTFGLHETNRDHPDYKPARWMVVLGQLHKKQTIVVPVRKPQPPAVQSGAADAGAARAKHDNGAANPSSPVIPAGVAAGATNAPPPAPERKRHPLPLRIFFLTVCVGLFSATATGLYMSYKYTRNKVLVTVALLAGIAVPWVLVYV